MQDTGFDFLIEHLENFDIEPLQFPSSADENRLREFFWAHKAIVEAHHEDARAAADEYFSAAIEDAKSILVVDVGWTGTCISALRSFLRDRKGAAAPKVVGALLGTSRATSLHDAVASGRIHPFIYSPAHNIELTNIVMPGGKATQRERDLRTLPIEYSFTAIDASVVSYGRASEGKAVPLRGTNRPPNSEQIIGMQQGMLDFIEQYLDASKGFTELRRIGPYLAFQPMRSALGKKHYLYAVYRDFLYDAAPVLHGSATNFERYGALFDDSIRQEVHETLGDLPTELKRSAPAKRILFISPEMKYVGAPKSLLRLCKVARELGYEPLVWTAIVGPFVQEFERVGIEVSVVKPEIIDQRMIDNVIRDNVQLVVCNTVVTHKFVKIFEGVLPVVWYVREATNLPDFLRSDPERAETLHKSQSVVVVSDYAAQAVSAFAKGKIEVVRNAIEDVSHYALSYAPRKGGKTRFVQLGTIEHRKGYDVFVAAYKAMPPEYRSRAELHFAGGMINSATSFASFILGEIKSEPGIVFHGLIEDERKKIELMSQMDVVVVASRDESCSLVALEGAMLSKPLIVTENVGAKYMVTHRTGAIVPTGDVTALRDAFMHMIDLAQEDLISMGAASRDHYKTSASLEVHKRDLNQLFSRRIRRWEPQNSVSVQGAAKAPAAASRQTELFLSLTSHPPRMQTISACIRSLLAQSKPADRCILWLSEEQFPRKMDDLPPNLTALATGRFEVRWVPDDLGPHKKYLYAMQEFPQSAVITVDDDVEYDPNLVQTLYEAHLQRKYSVIATRCHLVRFRPDGTLRSYVNWGLEHQNLRGVDTYALIPTGIGGVLYPPGALPVEAFQVPAIKDTCLHADDLWLKVMTVLNGYPVFMPHRRFEFRTINGSQNAALWRGNYFGNGNDEAMQRILDHVEMRFGASGALSRRMRGVREDGTFVGVNDELDTVPLISATLRKVGT
jgi:glycosyltransferase involved in cell wall biosynthesis